MKHFFLQHFYLCVLFLRLFSWLLVTAGIYVLSAGARMLWKSYTGPLLLEMPLTQLDGTFEISRAGLYAIWQKGDLLRGRPIETIRPHIYESPTGKELPLLQSLSGKAISNETEKRIEIFTFQALAGKHRLEIESGVPLSKLDAYMEGIFPLPLNPATHFLQIRQTQPALKNITGFVLLLAGVLVTVFGLLLVCVVEWVVVQ